MSELAEEVTLSRGGATRLVARMEQAGLVEREVPAHDRRATYARLTPAGQDALERAMPVHLAAVQERFSRHIDDAQAAALRDAFAAILIGNGVDCAALNEAAAQVDAA
jgi:DNA-binding MarR family transcriptional regulator